MNWTIMFISSREMIEDQQYIWQSDYNQLSGSFINYNAVGDKDLLLKKRITEIKSWIRS